jgi:hypothetical protein
VLNVNRGLDCTRYPSSPPSSTPAAGEARDKDVEERCNSGDDAFEYGGDTIDNCHQTRTDGTEETLDLRYRQ